MDDILLSSETDIDTSSTGLADTSAAGTTTDNTELISVCTEIKEMLFDYIGSDDETTETIEYNTDDLYIVLNDIKSLNSCILIILVVTITISVFRKLFDQF